jgi:transcriptional regulator NrdR family protein
VNCPTCGHDENMVLRTTESADTARRTRQCSSCSKRFITVEAREEVLTRARRIEEAYRSVGRALGEE